MAGAAREKSEGDYGAGEGAGDFGAEIEEPLPHVFYIGGNLHRWDSNGKIGIQLEDEVLRQPKASNRSDSYVI